MYQQVLVGLTITLASMVLVLFILKWTGGGPKKLGWSKDGLQPCDDSPNCQCSEDPRPSFHADRLELGSPAKPREIADRIATLPRTTLVKTLEGPIEDPVYGSIPENHFLIHWEFKTPLIGYIDDFQIAGKTGEKTVQVRSASRAGHSDLGVNKARIEMVRAHLKNQP